jgi:hypothetical protein
MAKTSFCVVYKREIVDSELFYTSLTIAEVLVVDGKLISYVGH